jgi:thiaminase (transcriptional activator TenA)
MPDVPPESLFARLRAACAEEWQAYTQHRFVREIGTGRLPERCFRHYLGQDYLFLIHFARAYALAVVKADSLDDMRRAARAMSGILDVEMGLHVSFCEGWGLSLAEMEALPEAPETMAYTRYVLERGMAGDVLDLHVALAPCVVGYAEIGAALAGRAVDANPYARWIRAYADEDYQAVAREAIAHLDRLSVRRGGESRFADLARTFAEATRLEAAFWDMGMAGAP